ncbi:Pr6Pr family membrane protein [Yinghuangia seranimata]|uniref:Pr6Pr family membrane protein n=1 Tax=Yinghuangia seranimata TaxID=408067 RepID=UPI00248AEC6B|nr:Pr6Pr family membrane protein [Yinghuangia seranimata]MDI2131820.1 Pr6Pr family membrane protein [Yinghuangia seranimata]
MSDSSGGGGPVGRTDAPGPTAAPVAPTAPGGHADGTGHIAERPGPGRQDVRTSARLWHGLTALVGITGLVVQLVLSARGGSAFASDNAAVRVLRYFSYFTIQSNILVAVTAVQLTLRPDRDGPLWRVLRLTALVCITTTGIVYTTVLAGIVELHGAGLLADRLLHYAVPFLAVLGWVLFGPRPRVERATPVKILAFPVLWAAYTLVHGAVTDWYPYPFTDVGEHGYVTVVRNIVLVGVLIVLLGTAFRFGDRALPVVPDRRRRPR